MNEEDMRKVFSSNLKYFLNLNKKQPADLVRDLNFNFSTVSNWTSGLKMPRIQKIELLAQYFGIEKSDLLEKREYSENKYLSIEMQNIIQIINNKPGLKELLYLCNDLTNEQIKTINSMIKCFKQ